MDNNAIIGIGGIVLGMAGLAGAWELRRAAGRPGGGTALIGLVVLALGGLGLVGYGGYTLKNAAPGAPEAAAGSDLDPGRGVAIPPPAGAKADIGQPLIAGAGPPPGAKKDGAKKDGKKDDGAKEGDKKEPAGKTDPEKQPDDKKAEDKKPEEKKPDEKKPDEKAAAPTKKKLPGDIGSPLVAGGGPAPDEGKKEEKKDPAPPPREKP